MKKVMNEGLTMAIEEEKTSPMQETLQVFDQSLTLPRCLMLAKGDV